MDEFNDMNHQSQEETTQEQPEVHSTSEYHGAGCNRKESPFADSPYVCNGGQDYQQGQEYRQEQQPPVKPPRKPHAPAAKKAVAGVLVAALLVTGSGLTAYGVSEYQRRDDQKTIAELNQKIQDLEKQIKVISPSETGHSVSGSTVSSTGSLTPAEVFAQNKKAVVAIAGLIQTERGSGTSAGSGFFMTEDGYVVTNAHVVANATSLTVITYDGEEYPASLVGADEINDLAVLKVDATGLPHVTMGSSDALIVGDQVVAVGNALGELSSSMTVGYVSGINRNIATDGSTVINMLQTDAAINSGNSGGPLFNMKGEVVGITSAKYSGTTSSGASIEGIGFAIPIDDVKSLIADLVEHGYVTSAYLGVKVSEMDPKVAGAYGLPIGVYVVEVTPGFCAEAAGVQEKDIILSLGDNAVNSMADLTRALRKFDAGETTTLTVFRNGREVSLKITLSEKPVEEQMPSEGNYEEWYDYFFNEKKD